MKETKTEFFRMRLTQEEKEKIMAYAEKRGLTMSEAVRELCYKIFNEKEN